MAGSGQSKPMELKRVADMAANQATEKAHAQAKSQLEAQRLEFESIKEDQRKEMLALQRQMQQQASEAEKEKLRQQMEHAKELAARDKRVMEDAMEKTQQQMEMMRDQMRVQDERFERLAEQHRDDMRKYREENKLDIEKMVEIVKSLNQQMDDVVFDPKEEDKYNQIVEQNFDKFCAAASAHLKNVPKLPKKSVAVLGQSGMGKSTLLNCFAGKKVAKTDLVECTDEVSMVYGDGPYDFYDVPGSHDARADFYKVEVLHKLKALHLVLLVCMQRVDHVLKVAKLMQSLEVPFIVVRNQCEFDKYDAEKWKEVHEKEAEKLKIYTKRDDIPMIYVGKSPDPENGAPMQGFDELRSCMDAEMAKAVAKS